MMIRLFLIAGLALAGCNRDATRPVVDSDETPSGGGTYVDESGELHTLFESLGTLVIGVPQIGQTTRNRRTGWLLSAEADDPIVISVAPPLQLTLYGPRSEQGLWADAITSANTRITHTVSSPGTYFVLVSSPRNTPYTITLECEGCADICPDLPACNRVCSSGFVRDADECETCECITEVCEPVCADNQRCIEGRCTSTHGMSTCADTCPPTIANVCGADEQTYRNRCVAACNKVQVRHAGSCRVEPMCSDQNPCPDAQQCVDGQCITRCDCPQDLAPVCGTDGQRYRNACRLRCAQTELAYRGPCVDQCDDQFDCAPGRICAPAPSVPENRIACRDPESTRCIRTCLVIPRCNAEIPCARDRRCYGPANIDGGVCVPRCRPQAEDSCGPNLVCVVTPDSPENEGICLRPCGRDQNECRAPLRCMRDEHGVAACQVCACPDSPDAEPVCSENMMFPSACHARCAGVRAQPCRPEPPRLIECLRACELRPDMTCGDDGRLYLSACEARCFESELASMDRCFEDPPMRRCRSAEDCHPTGCSGSICATEPTRECPDVSPFAACYTRFGDCGCVNNVCQFGPSIRVRSCLQRLQRRLGG